MEKSLQNKNDQIVGMNQKLSDKLSVLDDLQKDFLSRNGDLRSMKEKINSLSPVDISNHEVIDRLRSEVVDYECGISELRDQLSGAKSLLIDKEHKHLEELSQLTQLIQKKEVSLDETVNQLNTKKTLVVHLNDELMKHKREFSHYTEELTKLSNRLNEKDIEIVNVRKGLSSWIDKVKQQNAELQNKDSEVILLKSQLKTLERETSKLKDELRKNKKSTPAKNDAKKSPYDILGVAQNTPFDEIKKAYRNAVKKYNPHIVESLGDDVRELVVETSKEINLAYSWFKAKYGVS
jgi:chromosome segregation ATPase